MNVLETVARILKLEGVEWVSCYPSNELIEAVASEGIRTIMFRQERGAIMAADGFSRVSNRNRNSVWSLPREAPVRRIPWAVSLRHSLIAFPSCTLLRARPGTDTPFDRISRLCAPIRASPNAAKSLCNPVRLPAQCAGRFMPSVTALPGR